MTVFQSDTFERLISDDRIEITNPGPLHYPIQEFKVKRDGKLKIFAYTTAKHGASSNSIDYPSGTLRSLEEIQVYGSVFGGDVILKGVQPLKLSETTDPRTGTRILAETAYIHSVEITYKDNEEGCFLIEWLDNVEEEIFLWPDSAEELINESSSVILKGQECSIEIKSGKNGKSISRNCIYIKIDNIELFLMVYFKDDSSREVKSGAIVYKGVPSECQRKKIRNCLSFALGRPLIYLGHNVYDSNWGIIYLAAVSAYTYEGAAFNINTMPPSPLGFKYKNEIDTEVFSKLVNALYFNYDICSFDYISWAYWHAVTAPIHIAAVHFGAAIEALQNSYLNYNRGKFSARIIEKSEWKKFKSKLVEVLRSAEIQENEREALEIKINNLNKFPQWMATEKFFGYFLDI